MNVHRELEVPAKDKQLHNVDPRRVFHVCPIQTKFRQTQIQVQSHEETFEGIHGCFQVKKMNDFLHSEI